MTLQTNSFDSSATWNSPYGVGTGARMSPIRATWDERTTIDALSTVVDSLSTNDASWALQHYGYDIPENSQFHIVPVFTSSTVDSFTLRRLELRSEFEPEAPNLATEDQITLIRSALSLRVTEFAEIMDVKRPTIYGWLEGDFSPHPEKKVRIATLFEVAKKWRSLNSAPLGKSVRDSIFESKSILDLLKETKLNVKKIVRCLEVIDSSSKQTPLATRRKGLVADAMRRQGLDPNKAKTNKAELAAITGRRFEDD